MPKLTGPRGSETSNTMNILHTIEVDVKKFFDAADTRLGKWVNIFNTLFKKAPTALQTVDNFVAIAAPEIEAGVELVDPLVEPAVAAGLSTIEVGLAAIATAAKDANSGQSLLQNLKNFAADVPAVLGGIDVKNPALKAVIVKITNVVVSEASVLIPAVEAWVKQIEARRVSAAPAPTSGSAPAAA